MIDGQQTHPVEIDGFLERFHEAEAQNAGVPSSLNIVEKSCTLR